MAGKKGEKMKIGKKDNEEKRTRMKRINKSKRARDASLSYLRYLYLLRTRRHYAPSGRSVVALAGGTATNSKWLMTGRANLLQCRLGLDLDFSPPSQDRKKQRGRDHFPGIFHRGIF